MEQTNKETHRWTRDAAERIIEKKKMGYAHRRRRREGCGSRRLRSRRSPNRWCHRPKARRDHWSMRCKRNLRQVIFCHPSETCSSADVQLQTCFEDLFTMQMLCCVWIGGSKLRFIISSLKIKQCMVLVLQVILIFTSNAQNATTACMKMHDASFQHNK